MSGSTVPREMTYGHREAVALRKIGDPADFHFYSLEFVGDATILIGCVVTRLHEKGKKKGRPDYSGPSTKVIVTDSEIKVEQQRYADETGNCPICYGKGKEWMGWDHETGHRYVTCRTCGGTGKHTGASNR